MTRVLSLVFASFMGIASVAVAQEPAPAPPDAPNMTPGEVQKLFDAYIVVEAQRALDLNDSQYPQFIAKLRTLQDTRRRNQQERMKVMMQLQRLTAPKAPPPDNATLEGLLANLQEIESRAAAETRKAYNDLDQVLDIRQRARFRVLEEQVERRKIELLTRARQQNRPKLQ